METGFIIDDAVATTLRELTLQRVDGQWKVATNVHEQRWDGVVECVAS
jgi:hypothetical protein